LYDQIPSCEHSQSSFYVTGIYAIAFWVDHRNAIVAVRCN
jgi:hypothetical protein